MVVAYFSFGIVSFFILGMKTPMVVKNKVRTKIELSFV